MCFFFFLSFTSIENAKNLTPKIKRKSTDEYQIQNAKWTKLELIYYFEIHCDRESRKRIFHPSVDFFIKIMVKQKNSFQFFALLLTELTQEIKTTKQKIKSETETQTKKKLDDLIRNRCAGSVLSEKKRDCDHGSVSKVENFTWCHNTVTIRSWFQCEWIFERFSRSVLCNASGWLLWWS